LRHAMLLTGLMAFAAATFCVVAVIALIQRNTAHSRELAVNSGYFLSDDAELSVLLATEALRVRRTDEAEDSLREGLSRDLLRRVLPGRAGGLTRVAFNADETRLVTASEQGVLQLWNAATGLHLLSFKAHRTPIASVAFSPDGRLLVTASAGDSVARVWNVSSGRLVHELTGHTRGLTHAEFSHDGKSVVTSSSDTSARVWNAQSGELTAVLSGHTERVNTAAFSVDDRSVFTASSDDYAIKWDLSTGKPVAKFEHTGEVYALALSPDGKLVATGTRGFAEVLDTDHLQVKCELLGHDDDHEVIGVRFSADGSAVATAGTDGVSLVADVNTIQPGGLCSPVKLVGHNGSVTSVAFGANAGSVITASADHTARLWEARTGRLLSKLVGHEGPLTEVVVANDGTFAASVSADGSARLWQLDSSHPRRVLAGSWAVVAPLGSHALTWSETSAAIWDINDGHEVGKLASQVRKINDALFSVDGTLLLTVDSGGTANVWDASSGKLLHGFHADATALSHGSISRDGLRVAVASSTGLVRIWNLRTEQLQTELRGHAAVVNSLMFSYDGRRLLTASDDGTARIWDTSSGSALVVYRGNVGSVKRATFTPDGARVISVGPANQTDTTRIWNNYPIPIWDARSGKDVFLLSGHTDYVHDAELSPNGKLAVSASEDTTSAVWDVQTGTRISVLSGHQQGVVRSAFNADGKFVVTTGGDCSLRVWDARSGRMTLEFGEDVGCFDDPQFSADSRSIVARSISVIKGYPPTQEIAVLPCELCVDPEELLALAGSRLSRGLSAAERARYLK
jgi:WD40 repeat protein